MSEHRARRSRSLGRWPVLAAALGLLTAAAITQPATAQTANVTPKRLVFSRLGQASTVFVFNQGTETSVFDITLVDRIMTGSGDIAAVADAATRPDVAASAAKLQSAAKMIVVTPRRVTLAPGKGQTIRIRAVAPADLPAGEYRTHLTVAALPPADRGFTAAEAADPSKGELAFRINTIIGISIPLIVRQGPADVRAAFVNPQVALQTLPAEPGVPARNAAVFDVDLARNGTSSLFGNIEVRSADAGAKRGPLAQIGGVGVYPEIDRRHIRLILSRVPDHGEHLVVTLKDDDQTPGAELARATFTVP